MTNTSSKNSILVNLLVASLFVLGSTIILDWAIWTYLHGSANVPDWTKFNYLFASIVIGFWISVWSVIINNFINND